MTGFLPSGYMPIGIAVILAVRLWNSNEAAEEEKRGGPRSMGFVENADGSEVELVEPTVAESMLYDLRQHLFTGTLPSYALADDGRILNILPQHWGSQHAELELQGIPSCTILTDQGAVQGTPLVKFEELQNLFTTQPASTVVQRPAGKSLDLRPGVDKPDRQSENLHSKRQRMQTERSRATAKLAELYGDGIPTQGEVSNKSLERAVNEGLPSGQQLKRDTILRAAGRRK